MRLFEGTQWDVPPRCDRCEELESDCKCPPLPPPANVVDPSNQKLKIRVEKRKRGKIVTVIVGLANDDARSGLLKELKNLVGSGGTIRDEDLEIQGDHADTLAKSLLERGYQVRQK
ncbi:translation initiation factor [Mariniblastus fucicola]|uniref:Translation initiation factor Sui1 n=1 Tax=Mariniblastus fucicola TaxID=980251 RepID=A0A5B9PCD1_9BACT|nr:translation initiation factor [Mariniblastus fucicola]QEG24387.1 translation initiation factor Sui1 [Mariniblastus fucicola]